MNSPTNPATDAPRVTAWRWWVCALLFMATTLNYMDRVALNQLAVRIQTALSLDDKQYSRLESGFSFAFALGAFLTGFVVDRISVRWVYPFMVLGWSIAGVLTGFATGFWWLFACRIALGLFEAGNWPCGIRTTRAILRPEERSFGNSLFQSGTAFGAIFTPMIVLFLLRWADPDEQFRNSAVAVVGGTYAAVVDAPTDTWRFPFRVIGVLGLVWVLLWFVTVRGRWLREPPGPAHTLGVARYRDVFRDRRFWALFAMTIGINIAWHTYRAWLPKYLQQKRGLSEEDMTAVMTGYYLTADIGSWTVGLLTLVLIRRGLSGHATRTLAFAGCAGVALMSLAVPFAPTGWQLTLVSLIFAFAALGLFPTYFAMTQDVSAAHQGKVTGTLGAAAHMTLALVVYPIQGAVIQAGREYEFGFGGFSAYDRVLGLAGVFPLLALILMLWLWPPWERQSQRSA